MTVVVGPWAGAAESLPARRAAVRAKVDDALLTVETADAFCSARVVQIGVSDMRLFDVDAGQLVTVAYGAVLVSIVGEPGSARA